MGTGEQEGILCGVDHDRSVADRCGLSLLPRSTEQEIGLGAEEKTFQAMISSIYFIKNRKSFCKLSHALNEDDVYLKIWLSIPAPQTEDPGS